MKSFDSAWTYISADVMSVEQAKSAALIAAAQAAPGDLSKEDAVLAQVTAQLDLSKNLVGQLVAGISHPVN